MVFGFGSKKKKDKDKDAPESSADAAKAAQSGRNRRLSIFSSKKDKPEAAAVDEMIGNMTISPPSVQNVRLCYLSFRAAICVTFSMHQVNFDVVGGLRVAERADPQRLLPFTLAWLLAPAIKPSFLMSCEWSSGRNS